MSEDKILSEAINQPIIYLKDFDMRSTNVAVHMICKIKKVKVPVVHYDGTYSQSCIVYDEDTTKTIDCSLDAVAEFDKWENGNQVELWGFYSLDFEEPLHVFKMVHVESDSSEDQQVTFSRDQETPGYTKWRNDVIKRDEVCQCCGLNKHLVAHHIFGYKEHPELAVNVDNGITLCQFCHDKYHSIYGVKDINPHDLVEFIRKYSSGGC